ncbi:hypothetical protein PanWU01x14_154600, partial [Parasponia andersonii]
MRIGIVQDCRDGSAEEDDGPKKKKKTTSAAGAGAEAEEGIETAAFWVVEEAESAEAEAEKHGDCDGDIGVESEGCCGNWGYRDGEDEKNWGVERTWADDGDGGASWGDPWRLGLAHQADLDR